MSLNLKNKDLLFVILKNISLFCLFQVIFLRTFIPTQSLAFVHLCLVFSWMAFAFLAIFLLLKQEYEWRNFSLFLAIFCLIFSCLVSLLFCRNVHAAETTLMMWVSDICLFFCCYFWAKDQAIWRFIVFALLCVFCIELMYGFYQYYFDLPALKLQVQQKSDALLSLSENKQQLLAARILSQRLFGHFPLANHYGLYLVVYTVVVASVYYKSVTKKNIGTLLFFLIAGIMSLYLTKSRGAFLGFFVAISFVSLGYVYSRKRFFYLGSFSCLVGSLVLYSLMCYTPFFDFIGDSSLTFLSRIGYWQTTILMFPEHGLTGIGVDNFSQYFYQYKPLWLEEVNNAHNFYLQFSIETGILGMAALLFFGVVFCRNLCEKEIAETEENPNRLLFFSSGLVSLGFVIMLQSLSLSDPGQKYLDAYGDSAVFLGRTFFWGLITVGIVVLYKQVMNNRFFSSILGLRIALISFAVHAFIDTNFYTFNLSHHFWILFALYIARMKSTPHKVSPGLYISVLIISILFILFLTIYSPHSLQKNNFSQVVKTLQTNDLSKERVQKYYKFLQQELLLNPSHAQANIRLALLLLKSLRSQLHNVPRKSISISKVVGKINSLEQHIQMAGKDTILKNLNGKNIFYRDLANFWLHLQEKDKMKVSLQKALQISEQALEVYPSSSYFLLVHGQTLENLGDNKAYVFYKKALWCSDMIYPAVYGLSDAQKKFIQDKLAKGVK
ncbi:O-antigen ligase family protein [Candidatus Uabimicrobium sp. HlEnr_7]|uniref:O-antigen ligase family protein n=1 Tax=Candidatus Uabimicrobium helgolandensis TaxID=3095367 RepID=UPI003557CFED